MDYLLADCPGRLDWSWALSMLDQDVRVSGEQVPADGVVATVTAARRHVMPDLNTPDAAMSAHGDPGVPGRW